MTQDDGQSAERATADGEKLDSSLSLVSGAVALARRLSHAVARAWDLRWALRRQAEFNHRIVDQLDAHSGELAELAGQLAELTQRIRNLESQAIETDHAILISRVERAESRIALRRDLDALARRLDRLESSPADNNRDGETRAAAGDSNGRAT